MNLSDFSYHVPEHLIAQTPADPRDTSRLMVVRRKSRQIESHYLFKDLPSILNDDYTIVLNNSKVIKSRFEGLNQSSGTQIDLYLLKKLSSDRWLCQDCSESKLEMGDVIHFVSSKMLFHVERVESHETDHSHNTFECRISGVEDVIAESELIGKLPLPPYIKSQEAEKNYQTVYAEDDKKGSVAAPTAGLHFTDYVFTKLRNKGIKKEAITLHVGYGTFEPIEVEELKNHKMHSEHFSIDKETAARLNARKSNGGKVLAVGTTSTRVLETCSNEDGVLIPQTDDTDLFVYPGYHFKFVDAMLTNFHVPGYSPIMLVSALADKDLIMQAYKIAIEEEFRFYSYGDSMLIID